jgi:hypothetical protein
LIELVEILTKLSKIQNIFAFQTTKYKIASTAPADSDSFVFDFKRFCISRGGMQKILHEMCEGAVLSEREFSVACAPKENAG